MNAIDGEFMPENLEELGRGGFLPGDGKLKYTIVECWKRGTENAVFRLRMQDGQTDVVLKASKDATRLEHEYRTLSELAKLGGFHCPVPLAFWREGDMQFLLRSYIDGLTLSEYVQERERIWEEDIRDIGKKLCDCLVAFHQQGFVLRDIKPDNVILTAHKQLYFIDLETLRRTDPRKERDTICLGTQGFAAPEQFGYAQTDNRTDIYGLGMILLTLCTGSAERKELSDAPVSRQLKHVITKCISFDPKQRFSSADQLRENLLRKSKRRGIFVLTTTVAVLCVAGIVYALHPRAPAPVQGAIVYNNHAYATLEEAVEAIPNWTKGEIVLSEDIVVRQPVFIEAREVTLSGKGTLKDCSEYPKDSSGMLVICVDAKLTIKEDIVVQGANGALPIDNSGIFILDGGALSSWDSWRSGNVIFNDPRGTIFIEDGMISCSIPEGKEGWLCINNGSITMNGGIIYGYGGVNGILNQGVVRRDGGFMKLYSDNAQTVLPIHCNDSGATVGNQSIIMVNDVRQN